MLQIYKYSEREMKEEAERKKPNKKKKTR